MPAFQQPHTKKRAKSSDIVHEIGKAQMFSFRAKQHLKNEDHGERLIREEIKEEEVIINESGVDRNLLQNE